MPHAGDCILHHHVVSWSARRKVAFFFCSAGTTPLPSATSPIYSTQSVVRTPNLPLVAAASAFRSLTLVIVLSFDAAMHPCLEQVIASACIRSLTSSRILCGSPGREVAFRSPLRPRRHSHLPRHRFYPRHVLLELNIPGLGSRPSRLAPKPLARTNVNVSRDNPFCQPDCALRFYRPILRESACAIPNARALGYSWRFFSEADCVRERALLCARPPLCHAPLCLVTFHVCPQVTLLPSRVTTGSFGLHHFCVFIVPCHQDRLCPPRCLSRR